MNTYIIEGGIGKQVAFTAIIDALVKKDKEKIQIHSPYVDIFGGNTNIKFALEANTIPVHDKRILDSQNICYCEPYKANFIKGDHHIIQSYCKLFGVKYEEKMRPKLYTDHYKDPAKKIAGDDDFIVNYENSKEIYKKANTKKAIWIVEDAGHVQSFNNQVVREAFLKFLMKEELLSENQERYFDKRI